MQVHDVALYIQQDLPRPQFYIQDILPKQGVMLVYGSPKVKKSWLVQHMGYNLSVGAGWLGFRTERARTLLAQFEIAPIAYGKRLQDMGRLFHLQERTLYEVSPGLTYLDEPEKYNAFSAAIREYHPQVIILDCMAACFGGDENNPRDMAKWIQILVNLKQEHDAAIVLVHHTNKNVLAFDSANKARGHSRLTGWVDTLVYMVEQPTGVQLQFKARQSTRELPNINIQFANYNWTVRPGN